MVVDGTPTAEGITGYADVEVAVTVTTTAGCTGAGLIDKTGFCTNGGKALRQMVLNSPQEQVGKDLTVGMLRGRGCFVGSGI